MRDAMEMMLTGTAIQALAQQIKSMRAHFKGLAAGLSHVLIKRDGKSGGYRTKGKCSEDSDAESSTSSKPTDQS